MEQLIDIYLFDEETESKMDFLKQKFLNDLSAVKRSYTAKNMLKSGNTCIAIRNLILVHIGNCLDELQTDIFNKIKAGKIEPIPHYEQIKSNINKKMEEIRKEVDKKFLEELKLATSDNTKRIEASLKDLDVQIIEQTIIFHSNFIGKLEEYRKKIEAQHAILAAAEEANIISKAANKISHKNLKKAEEANQISRWSKNIAIFAAIIALLAILLKFF